MPEFSHDDYQHLRNITLPFETEIDKTKLIATVEGVDPDDIETLFYIADTIGYEETSKLFFAIRELLRQLENPNKKSEDTSFMIEHLLKMHDEITETIVEPNNIDRKDITDDMLRPGTLKLSLARMERNELLEHLRKTYKDSLDTTLISTQRAIAAEFTAIQQNEHLDSEDFAVLLHLLGIEKIENEQIVMSPAIMTDESTKTLFNQQILEIGGSLSRKWQEYIWVNPIFDPTLYQKLKDINFTGEDILAVIESLAQKSSLKDLLSLINGGTLVDNRLNIAVHIFLDRVASEQPNSEQVYAVQEKVEHLLLNASMNKQEIYEILRSLISRDS